jgi:hypothetical protein
MTEAALAPESPHAPSVIRLLLGKLGIAYEEVLDHHGLNASRKVQAVLLDDAVGALMVLFPQSQLLDLNRLAELTGRRLTAVSTERLEKMLGKQPEPAAGPAGADQFAVPLRRKPAARTEAADQLRRAGPAAGNRQRRLQDHADQGQRRQFRRSPEQHPSEPRPPGR